MRVSVVGFAALAAMSVSASWCHAGSIALPGTDGSAQSPGLATTLPGSDLCDLQPSLTRPSSPDAIRHDAMESGAMVTVLADPSLLAAAPGTPACAALTEAQRPPTHSSEALGGPSPGTAGSGTGLGFSADPAPGASPAAASHRSANLGTAPSAATAFTFSGQEKQAREGINVSSGLLSSRELPANPPSASSPALDSGSAGAGLPQDGGLFCAAVTPAEPRSGALGVGPAAGSEIDGPGARIGPMLPGTIMALAAAARERRPESSHHFAPITLAWLGLAAAPFAAVLLRRRLV